MAAVDAQDDSIPRFVVFRYAYDPRRLERRHTVVAAFDHAAEQLALLEKLSAELAAARERGDAVDEREHISAKVWPPGHFRQQANARFIRRAIRRGHALSDAEWDRVANDLPTSTSVLRFSRPN